MDLATDLLPDSVSERIADYVVAQREQPVREGALHEAKRRILDSIGCAVAAMDSAPAQIARGLAAEATAVRGASVIGLGTASTIELAAFANTVMVRYLDCNDIYFTSRGGGGHPSDMIPTACAVGEATGASGHEVLRAVILGYEVNGALAGAVWLRERGWDQGLNVVAATAMMAGDLLGLDKEQLGHALALAVTPHVPVRQTRIGQLSMWKGCATAGAVRNGIFAALLAERGMTGPAEPYVGRSGIWELVTGPFDLVVPLSSTRSIIEDTAIKLRPAEFNAQAPIDLVLDLRDVCPSAEIESIDVRDLLPGLSRDRDGPRQVGSAEPRDRRPQPAVSDRRRPGRRLHRHGIVCARACCRPVAATAAEQDHDPRATRISPSASRPSSTSRSS